MPSLQCFMTAILSDEEPVVPDLLGLYGYNVYTASIRLQGSDIPVTIAHYTRERRLQQGVLARIIGSGHTSGSSFLIVAVSVKPVSFLPIPGPLPKDYDLLRRIVFSGVVSSAYAPIERNEEGFSVDVTIDRPDGHPAEAMVLLAVFNRDATHVKLNAHLDIGTNVYGRGVVCGWSKRNVLMVDVHHIEYNCSGGTPKHLITDPLNPYRHIVLGKDGWPSRNKTHAAAAPAVPTWDILSFSIRPTRVTRADPASDPRVPSAGARPETESSDSSSSTAPSGSESSGAAVTLVGGRAEQTSAPNGGATNANSNSARLISGWNPGDFAATGRTYPGDPVDSQAVAGLLSFKSASTRVAVEQAVDGGDEGEDDGDEGGHSQSSVDPRLRAMNVSPVQGNSGSSAAPVLSVHAVRDSLKRKGFAVRGRALKHAEGASGSAKRPRVTLHVTPK